MKLTLRALNIKENTAPVTWGVFVNDVTERCKAVMSKLFCAMITHLKSNS